MNFKEFQRISIYKKTNIYYDGKAISHTIIFKDGRKKTLGVFLPNNKPLLFLIHVDEYIEITSGKCLVQIGINNKYKIYSAGDKFFIPKNNYFKIKVEEVVDYVCHLN